MPRPSTRRKNIGSAVKKHVVEKKRWVRGQKSSCSLQDLKSNMNDDDNNDDSSASKEDSNDDSSEKNSSNSSTMQRQQKPHKTRKIASKQKRQDDVSDHDSPSEEDSEESSEEENSSADAGSNYSEDRRDSDDDDDDGDTTSNSDDSEPLAQKLKRSLSDSRTKGVKKSSKKATPQKRASKAPRPVRRTRGSARTKEQSTDDESVEVSSSDDENVVSKRRPQRRRSRESTRTSKKMATKGRISKASRPIRKKKVSSRTRGEPSEGESEEVSSTGDDASSSEQDSICEKRSNYRTRRSAQLKDKDDSSRSGKKPQSLTSPLARRSSPKRASAEKASKKFASIEHTYDDLESEENIDDDDNVLSNNKKKAGGRKNMGRNGPLADNTDEEEFVANSSSSSAYVSLEDEDTAKNGVSGLDKSKNADDSEVEFDSGPESGRGVGEKTKSNANAMQVKDGDIGDEESSSSSDGEVEEDTHTGQKGTASSSARKKSPSPSKKRNRVPCCPSKDDAITFEPLPRPPEQHVCYVTPDGSTRECFKLETLHKIALTQKAQYRTDSSGKQIRTFSQPPHFRAPMSDSLLEQIADKFGRRALDLHGLYYQTKTDTFGRPLVNGGTNHYSSAFGRNDLRSHMTVITQEARSPGTDTFQELINRYWQSTMGSQDVYVCPLCYTVSHALMEDKGPAAAPWKDDDENETSEDDDNDDEVDNENYRDGDDDKESGNMRERDNNDNLHETDDAFSERYPTKDFKEDPLAVLAFPDDDKYETAAGFSFRRISDCKAHLREIHSVDPQIIQGSDLYMRFKVRAPDGLLQRWIKGKYRQYTKQGYLQRYWNDGNSGLFVHLLHQMIRFEECQRIVQEESSNHNEETDNPNNGSFDDSSESRRRNAALQTAKDFLQQSKDFAASFRKDAARLWAVICAPHSIQDDDMKDFVDDGEGAEEGEGEYIAIQEASFRRMENSQLEEELEKDAAYVNQLKEIRKRQKAKRKTDDSDETDQGDDDDGDKSESENESVYANTSEDEEEQDSDDVVEVNGDDDEESDDWMKQRLAPPKKRMLEEKKVAAGSETKNVKKFLRRSPASKAKDEPARKKKMESESEDDGVFFKEDGYDSSDDEQDLAILHGQDSIQKKNALLEDSDDE